jgi:hypothetical protein
MSESMIPGLNCPFGNRGALKRVGSCRTGVFGLGGVFMYSGAMPDGDRIKQDECYSEAETVARREAALKRMLATPHKRQRPLAEGKDGR